MASVFNCDVTSQQTKKKHSPKRKSSLDSKNYQSSIFLKTKISQLIPFVMARCQAHESARKEIIKDAILQLALSIVTQF